MPPDTPSGTRRRDTPPAQGGKELLGRDDCGRPFDPAARVPAVQVVRVLAAIQFPRQSAGHSSCATEGRFHSAVLGQGCAAVAFTDKVVDIPVLAFRTVEVPQIQSSTGLNDNFEAKWVFFGAFCAIFRTHREGVESRGAWIFRALDDEEFFVVEGSLGDGVAGSLTPR